MGGAEEHLSVEERIRYEVDGISPRRQAFDRTLRQAFAGGTRMIARHWLLLLNATTGLTVAGAFGAAYLASVGQGAAAQAMYQALLLLCPQRPSHSFYLWGEKIALEQRVLAIYLAALFAGLLYGCLRGRVQSLDWRLALLLSVPMLVDVLSQTVGWRESDWLWRTTTGAVSGLAVSCWALPQIDNCTRQLGWTGARPLPVPCPTAVLGDISQPPTN